MIRHPRTRKEVADGVVFAPFFGSMTSRPATSSSAAKSGAPPVVIPASGNNIIINPLQRGNPVLECIRNVGKEFGDIVADYQVGRTTGVLWLSLKYHRLHPEYIHTRIEKLGNSYGLRLLLILCDVTEHKEHIRELTRVCLINNITIIVAFSLDEAGHYLSTFKQFEFKSPDMIKERTEKDHHSILRAALTSISKVNKTDVETLRTAFGSFAGISRATSDQLQNLPGFGQVKVKNMKNAFEKPFRNNATSTLTSSQSQARAPGPSSQRETQGASAARNSNMEAGTSLATQRRRGNRSPSPAWDIELDLDLPDANDPAPTPPPAPPPRRPSPSRGRSPDLHARDTPPDGGDELILDLT
ncbi:DNA excision repair protein ERCC-1 [Coprinopsis cinerea okayama7|uniref:DNA excision repair protein ERCC-1 n=1 Tax=Coprinopsis cinerea (strain Okayama-7 / 130 / ATCC MYA-4618 / FGSC 9003) TaxID=240176 RepID=A8N5G8_COPC7|nr:DNA excision repair protein ERCC-1 [Coprinopsis cinerea okayama7\|eukprot:XP_001830113.2 DNA excision repair protein ERCC-1 [Coprinopsis cinerea okayama7\